MKDSWLLYDYIKRWWRLLLLCCALGILVAYLMDEPKVYAKAYSASATLAFTHHKWVPELPTSLGGSSIPHALVTVEFAPQSTLENIKAAINAKQSELSAYSGIPVETREIVIRENPQGTWFWWKALTLGGVIGLLAAIGFIYIWTDVQAYGKRELAAQSQ